MLVTLVPASPKKTKEIVEEEQRFKDPMYNSGSADNNDETLNSQHCCLSRMQSIALETVPPFCTKGRRFPSPFDASGQVGLCIHALNRVSLKPMPVNGLSSDLLGYLSGEYK